MPTLANGIEIAATDGELESSTLDMFHLHSVSFCLISFCIYGILLFAQVPEGPGKQSSEGAAGNCVVCPFTGS